MGTLVLLSVAPLQLPLLASPFRTDSSHNVCMRLNTHSGAYENHHTFRILAASALKKARPVHRLIGSRSPCRPLISVLQVIFTWS
jgi:hypothetical protein